MPCVNSEHIFTVCFHISLKTIPKKIVHCHIAIHQASHQQVGVDRVEI